MIISAYPAMVSKNNTTQRRLSLSAKDPFVNQNFHLRLSFPILFICGGVLFAEDESNLRENMIVICGNAGLLPTNNYWNTSLKSDDGTINSSKSGTDNYDSAFRIGVDLTLIPKIDGPVGIAYWGSFTYDRYAMSSSGLNGSSSTSNQEASIDIGIGPCFHPNDKLTIDIIPFVGGFLGTENATADYNNGRKLLFYETTPGYSLGIKGDVMIIAGDKFTFKGTLGYISTQITANGTADYYAPVGYYWLINGSNRQGVKVDDKETFAGIYVSIGCGVTLR